MVKKESTTDSDSGLFVKGEHERCFCLRCANGFVLAFEVGAGNVHDGQMFHELYKKMDLSRTSGVPILKTVFSENLSMFTMNISTVIFIRRIRY